VTDWTGRRLAQAAYKIVETIEKNLQYIKVNYSYSAISVILGIYKDEMLT